FALDGQTVGVSRRRCVADVGGGVGREIGGSDCGSSHTGLCVGGAIAQADYGAVETAGTDAGCRCGTDRDADGFEGVGADLEALGAEGAIEDLATTEAGGFGDTVQLLLQLRHFGLQSGTFTGAVGAVGRLQGQVTHTLEDAGGLLQGAFSGLRQGDTVVGVAGGDAQAVDLVGQAVGDLQTCSIVLGAVDAVAGGQALQRGVQTFRSGE